MRFQYRYPLIAAHLIAAFALTLAVALVFRGPGGTGSVSRALPAPRRSRRREHGQL